jgi:hypothetical protein
MNDDLLSVWVYSQTRYSTDRMVKNIHTYYELRTRGAADFVVLAVL